MSPRLSKIVTRTGDDGTTGLGDGTRVPKDSQRIEAMGAVDELNSALAVLLAQPLPGVVSTREWLLECQQRLFDLGSELAVPGLSSIDDDTVERLERQIEQLNAPLPPLEEFVLPGGGPAAAACHLARAICRRAERRCWALARLAAAMTQLTAPTAAAAGPKSRAKRAVNRGAAAKAARARTTGVGAACSAPATVSAASLRYLNRLSDFLFVLARVYARAAGYGEEMWRHERRGRRRPA